ncbi:MAG: hypothetical protein KAW45_01470 [Thermoplasmatales archaeon]|nr:hypothetical protein [Thermoplasmatales archaeon]
MKNKKMLGITFFVTVVMISSVMVIPMENIEAVENSNIYVENSNIYVDPNICIGYNEARVLENMLCYVESVEDKALVQEIINRVEDHGFVDSEDLEFILVDLGMTGTHIYSGSFVGYASCSSMMVGFPNVLMPFGFIYTAMLFWHTGTDDMDLIMGMLDNHVTENHAGFAVTYLGYWSLNTIYENGFPYCNWFEVDGWSPFICITYT